MGWQLLTHITSQTPHPHDFSITTAILNIMHLPKNHPLIILTNITRHIIDKAHSNSTTIHPNTILYKILNTQQYWQRELDKSANQLVFKNLEKTPHTQNLHP